MKKKISIVDNGNSKNYIADRLDKYKKDRIITREEWDEYRNGDPLTREWIDIILKITEILFFEEYQKEIQQYISISETMESDELSPPDGAQGLSLVEFPIYMKGYNDAYKHYNSILRKQLDELASLRARDNAVITKLIVLKGKSKKIYNDPEKRVEFINYYSQNSIKRTAKHFGIAQGTVQNIAENCGIKRTSH
jgi:hypothetical protein